MERFYVRTCGELRSAPCAGQTLPNKILGPRSGFVSTSGLKEGFSNIHFILLIFLPGRFWLLCRLWIFMVLQMWALLFKKFRALGVSMEVEHLTVET